MSAQVAQQGGPEAKNGVAGGDAAAAATDGAATAGGAAGVAEDKEAAAARDRIVGKRGKGGRKRSAVEACVEVVGCHTRVDVVWQDGQRDDDVAGTSFAPAKHVDGYYEFWPGDFIVGKSSGGEAAPPVGVVESVDHDQRLCVVTWRDGNKREVRRARAPPRGNAPRRRTGALTAAPRPGSPLLPPPRALCPRRDHMRQRS